MSTQTTIKTTRKRQSMNPVVNVQMTPAGSVRSSFGGGMGGGMTSMRRTNVMSSSFGGGRAGSGGMAGKLTKESVENVMSGRDKEKKDMGELNSRFANYIEGVKLLEAQNKCLVEEVEKLRKMKGWDGQRIKEEYEDEIQEARESIKTMSQELAPLQAKNMALQDKLDTQDDEINGLRKQIDSLHADMDKMKSIVGDLEGECAQLRLENESLCKECDTHKKEINRLREDNQRIRNDFEAAVAKQIMAESEKQCLSEEVDFITVATGKEIDELREHLANLKNAQPDIQKHWKSEFKDLCRVLQQEYNDQLDRRCGEMQIKYDEQLNMALNAGRRDETDSQIVKSENKTLKSAMTNNKNEVDRLKRDNDSLRQQLDDLRRQLQQECEECEEEKGDLRRKNQDLGEDLEDVMSQLEALRMKKMDLDLEISCYRKLLETEENSMKRAIESQGKLQSAGGGLMAGIISGGGGSSGGGYGSSSGGGGGGGGSSMSQQSNPDISKPSNKRQETGKLSKKPAPNAMQDTTTGTVRVTRSSKNTLSIAEVSQDGAYIKIQNTSNRNDFDLSNWKLERFSNKSGIQRDTLPRSYTFEKDYKLGKGKSVIIFGYAFGDGAGKDDLVASKANCNTWGTGNGNCLLKDPSKRDKEDVMCTSTIAYN